MLTLWGPYNKKLFSTMLEQINIKVHLFYNKFWNLLEIIGSHTIH